MCYARLLRPMRLAGPLDHIACLLWNARPWLRVLQQDSTPEKHTNALWLHAQDMKLTPLADGTTCDELGMFKELPPLPRKGKDGERKAKKTRKRPNGAALVRPTPGWQAKCMLTAWQPDRAAPAVVSGARVRLALAC